MLEKHISRQIARNDVFSYVDFLETYTFLSTKKAFVIKTNALNWQVNAVHLALTAVHKRYSCRQLRLGYPAAHG